MGKRWIAGSEDGVRGSLLAEFLAQGGLHVNLGQDTETLVLECVNRAGFTGDLRGEPTVPACAGRCDRGRA